MIPLNYPYATEENSTDYRYTIPHWSGCPRQFDAEHGFVTDAEWDAVVRAGLAG